MEYIIYAIIIFINGYATSNFIENYYSWDKSNRNLILIAFTALFGSVVILFGLIAGLFKIINNRYALFDWIVFLFASKKQLNKRVKNRELFQIQLENMIKLKSVSYSKRKLAKYVYRKMGYEK